jgi:hypothetical protein
MTYDPADLEGQTILKTDFLLTSDGDFENIESVKVIPVLPVNQTLHADPQASA